MAAVRLSSAEYIGESSRSASGHPSRKAACRRRQRRWSGGRGFFLIGMPDTMATRTAARQDAEGLSTGDTRACAEGPPETFCGPSRAQVRPYLGPRRERLERDDIQSGERLRVIWTPRAVIEAMRKEHLSPG
jgi:hypothetical protein